MNAVARTFVDPVSTWPPSLPWPQLNSVQTNWDQPTDSVGTLAGPTRFRLANPNASPSFEFEIQFTADECERFEAWYDNVVALGGEVYLPWIGEGRILGLTEYELSPLGPGWRLHALATQLYVDPEYVERHVCDAAFVWRMPVLVDGDYNYPLITCELPGVYRRPQLIDTFFSTAQNARLTDVYEAVDRFIADLTSNNWWNGNTWGMDGQPGEFAELQDTITAYLPATTLNYPIFIDIPANWMWDEQLDAWALQARMVYIDDWSTMWMQGWVNGCYLIKDTLPPPWAIVNGNDMLNFAWMEKIIADMFPLEVYFETPVDIPPPTLVFTVAPTTVNTGDSAVLTWASEYAQAVMASGGWSGKQEPSGSANTGPLARTTSYTLTASGPGGLPVAQTVTVAVRVPPPPMPTVTLAANPTSVVTGNATTLTWVATNATTVTASGGWSGSLGASGNRAVTLATTATFVVTASNATGTVTASVTVAATAPPPPPEVVGTVTVVAWGTGVPYQYGFFFGGPTTGGVGSVSPTILPLGFGQRIQAIASQQWYSLIIMCDGAARLTQTNQFDSVSVRDVYGVVRTFTTAPQAGLTFGNNPIGYATWYWEGTDYAIPGEGTYPITFRKAP